MHLVVLRCEEKLIIETVFIIQEYLDKFYDLEYFRKARLAEFNELIGYTQFPKITQFPLCLCRHIALLKLDVIDYHLRFLVALAN
jgi:hypothetical protein